MRHLIWPMVFTSLEGLNNQRVKEFHGIYAPVMSSTGHDAESALLIVFALVVATERLLLVNFEV